MPTCCRPAAREGACTDAGAMSVSPTQQCMPSLQLPSQACRQGAGPECLGSSRRPLAEHGFAGPARSLCGQQACWQGQPGVSSPECLGGNRHPEAERKVLWVAGPQG